MSCAADDLVAIGCQQEGASDSLTAFTRNSGKRKTFFHAINLWFERSRQRRELRELIESSEETFKDIGISRYDVQREERKPFWRD